MAVTLSTGVDLPEQQTPFRGGLLDRAYALPAGWESGVTVPFYGCGKPILRDKCISSTDTAHRDSMQAFDPFPIEQSSSCSTLGATALLDHATRRLEATSEWAVAQQLQRGIIVNDSPTLDDGSWVHPDVTSVVQAVSALEDYAAQNGFGTEWFLHAPTKAAAYLRDASQIDRDGRSPGGGTWIVSPGYTGETSGFVLYVTGPVWAGVDAIEAHQNVHRRMNDVAAWAFRVGLVAFDPCLSGKIKVVPTDTTVTP